jgi:GDP-4-dehydro-6-deoxy-D-mannose reductase
MSTRENGSISAEWTNISMPKTSLKPIRSATSDKKLRFLVLGGTGFIGRALREELRREQPDAAIFWTTRGKAPRASGGYKCDLTDARQVEACLESARPTHVFHAAGAPGTRDTARLGGAHVASTFNLLEAVRRLPSRRRPTVVVVGSAAEYGLVSPKELPIREDSPLRPATPYGWSKHFQDELARSYADHGVRVVTARLFNLLGPGLPEHLSAGSFGRQIAAIEHGRRPARLMVGRLDSKRDFIDVRDAARALRLLAERGKTGEAYNVCSGASVSIRSLLQRLLASSRERIGVTEDKGRRRSGDPADVFGSCEKLRRTTGWRPRIDWRSSLDETLASFRNGAKA